MYKTKCLREKLVLFLKIFFPILIYQFANYSASFVDTAMTGQYNTMDLAGVSMATSIWNPFFTFLTGIVSALVPIIGHHLGRGKKEEVASDFYQFIYLALGLSVVLLGMVLFLAPTILNHIGLEAAVAAVAVRYLWFLSIGIIPLLLFSVIRSLLDSLGLTKLSMYLMLLLLPLNSGFNYLLIYGAFGVPELGGAGAGLGTSLAYWVLLGISVLVLFKQEKLKALHLEKRIPLNMDNIKEGVRLGLPIGGTVFAEVAIFSVVGLIMAKFSSLIIASHQSAMNFSSLMYAFPMSISSAMAIVVSYEVGAKRFDDAKTYIGLGRWTALIFAAFTLTFLYIFRGNVASLSLAVVKTLMKHPYINASLTEDGKTIITHNYVNLAMAVGMDNGLMTPVVYNAEKMSLSELVVAFKDVIGRTLDGKLAPSELQNSTFTISNLGMFGIQSFGPIINQPNSAILGVSSTIEKPVVVNGEIVIRPIMSLGLTIDHRVVDGMAGAKFMKDLKELIETPISMLI